MRPPRILPWVENTMIKRKRTNNDLQNITQKTKDRAPRTTLKPEVKTCNLEGLAVPAPLVTPSCYC